MLRSVIKLRRGILALLLLVCAAPRGAIGQVPVAQERPLRYRPPRLVDVAVTAAGLSLTILPEELKNLPVASCAPCDPATLPVFDRGSVGIAGGDGASNAALLATVGGSALLVAWTRRGTSEALAATLEDAAVMAEAAAVDGALTAWLKVAVHRPRPERYTAQGAQDTTVDDSRSFPSGHASFAFAAAAAAASILQRRGVLARHKTETAILFLLAATTAALRVDAHRHFPSDIVAGAALGATVGWLVPQWHAVQ